MNTNNIGRCYELNFLYQVAHPDYILVHGYITNPFPPNQTIDHTWCMKDNKVYDAVKKEEYDWELYQALYSAEIVKQYNSNEAMDKGLEKGTYGCWHKVKDLNLDQYYKNDRNLKKEYKKNVK
jgi:hypothetical protein